MATPSLVSNRGTARERLLAAAESLFYEEGFGAVGIDRLIERAGVAKASLYYCFGSKDELIRSYLRERRTARQSRLQDALSKYSDPRQRLLGVFDFMAERFAEPTFRGCAFVKATAETHAVPGIKEVCDEARHWMLELFASLATAAGSADADALAHQLMMLYDGASVSAQMDGNPGAAATARAVAAALLDASVSGSQQRGDQEGMSYRG
jgi:AcrR family transcriptional regulator